MLMGCWSDFLGMRYLAEFWCAPDSCSPFGNGKPEKRADRNGGVGNSALQSNDELHPGSPLWKRKSGALPNNYSNLKEAPPNQLKPTQSTDDLTGPARHRSKVREIFNS